jgi:LacI family transcriptional regulator
LAVTMRDVATVAGVSVATVSRVLAGGASVTEEKIRLVQAACSSLGYRPDTLAASLRRGTSGFVGMLIPDISAPFFPAVVQSVEHELADTGIDLLFCDADNSVSTEAQRVETLLRRRVEALLICPVDSEASQPAIAAAATQVRVLQFERYALSDTDYVGVDQRAGMSQVVSHVRAQGSADAVFVGHQLRVSSVSERAAAFLDECDKQGVVARRPLPLPSLDIPAGRACGAELIHRGDLPAAIVCANDAIALGVLMELRAAGIRCPDDVLVIGYDDVPAAELVGLTSVRQPLNELGREAARLLGQSSTTARHVRLAPRLVVRQSSAHEETTVAGDALLPVASRLRPPEVGERHVL